MASAKDVFVNKAKLFLYYLEQAGIEVTEAYLFGSVTRDLADKDSDIDVAVVSKDFEGIMCHDIKKYSKYRRMVDLRLEIHPFSFDEVTADPPHFFLKIKEEGLRIH
ncbi:nucleotidyltransferase domain-containing protein [Desulfoglaeba alkanexedens]|jgi:hypothetical protein|uniref:Nucleotidyltransferase domain-containing protein n=1 Tax=Desulfoglaeba alkanexedens ALDC TaxID=980445 RepID=A0A4V1ERP6_9BACT|nr:nucleotidyltransferase domain-containing protein [Desulfoglaeba alkanexedens]QCQ22371.1 nucleotidyltransferase domain-containing protein [Desulfoglaeba alkanexedens ALDC]